MSEEQEYNRKLIAEFRASRSANPNVVPLEGRPLLLITTTGAKSGQLRTTPLMYIPHGDNLLIMASNQGAAIHPAWYHNIVAHSDITVEVGTETFAATAQISEGAARDEYWAKIIALYPFFAEYQSKTDRQIPVITLSRRTS